MRKYSADDIVTNKDIAEKFNVYKSKINYYVFLGLLVPIKRITGNTLIFDLKDVTRRLKIIDREQKKGKTLKEIAEKIKNDIK